MHHDPTFFELLWDKINPSNVHVFSALLVALILIGGALLYRLSLKSIEEELIPPSGANLKNMFQVAIEGILSLMEGVIGPSAKQYYPLIGTVFLYIFMNNILGTIPGFSAATSNINTNLACGLTVFFYYNYLGIKKQGLVNYLKHLMGPLWLIAPLLLVIELISHLVRPVTLSLRLMLNLTGDHIVVGIFSGLVPVLVPIVFMAFGIFVAFVQAFVFTLLSTVYIGMAVEHEEHH